MKQLQLDRLESLSLRFNGNLILTNAVFQI